MTTHQQIVLSGIRATGRAQLGNYFGAIQNFVRFQEDPGFTGYYFVADVHSLTTLDDPEALRSNLIEMVKDYLAAGLDPDRSVIYVQSSVPEIMELALYLGMFQPLGELQTIPTFKDLVRSNPERVSHGLLTYPVLMAADILGPRAALVPVGEDQVPNVELARDLAKRFNKRFGETFPVPTMMEQMVRVPGLDGDKMGKSNATNAIDMHASEEETLERYLRRGVTDPNRQRRNDPGNPGECRSVYPMHQLITPGEQLGEVTRGCTSGELSCVDCKTMMVRNLYGLHLDAFQERRRELESKDDYVREILHEGGKLARGRIAETVAEVREKIGITLF